MSESGHVRPYTVICTHCDNEKELEMSRRERNALGGETWQECTNCGICEHEIET